MSSEEMSTVKNLNEAMKAIKNLKEAEEKFLLAFGWEKVQLPSMPAGTYHFTPSKRVGFVFPGDKLLLDNAVKVQKDALNV